MVIVPGIGASDVAGRVVIISRAMEIVGAALGDHLNLRARGSIEIGGLAGSGDLDFLDGVNRGGQYSARRAGGSGATHARKTAARVGAGVISHRAVHVVRVVAAVELEGVLVVHGSGGCAFGGHAR